MSDVVIQVDRLRKKYRLGVLGTAPSEPRLGLEIVIKWM